jgi:hypothetical protein
MRKSDGRSGAATPLALASAGLYLRLAKRMTGLSVSETCPRRRNVIAAGTYVSDRSSEPTSAKTTVSVADPRPKRAALKAPSSSRGMNSEPSASARPRLRHHLRHLGELHEHTLDRGSGAYRLRERDAGELLDQHQSLKGPRRSRVKTRAAASRSRRTSAAATS